MRKDFDNSSLNQATPISNPTTVTGRIGRRNSSALFSFNLNQASSLNLKFKSSGKGASLQLFQDRNQNQQADADELLKAAPMHAGHGSTLNLSTLPGGSYLLKVSTTGRGNNNYQVSLSSGEPVLEQAARHTKSKGRAKGLNQLVQQIVNLTNDFRRQNGVAPLKLNNKLSQAAQSQSQSMAMQDFFDHTGKDGSTPSTRVSKAGYSWSMVAENIAAGYKTANEVMKGWINSPGHRANLLNPSLKEIGVGYFYLPNDTGSQNWNYYWTQDFGTPMR